MAVKAKAPDQPVPVQSPPPNVSATNPAAKPAPKPTPAPAVTSHDPRTAVIDKARAMLDEGRVQEAHKLLTRQKGNDPAIKNVWASV